MHLPELALLARGFGGERRGAGVCVHAQREILEHDAHLVGVGLVDLLEHRRRARTERALEVAELDDRDLRLLRAESRGAREGDLIPNIRIGTTPLGTCELAGNRCPCRSDPLARSPLLETG